MQSHLKTLVLTLCMDLAIIFVTILVVVSVGDESLLCKNKTSIFCQIKTSSFKPSPTITANKTNVFDLNTDISGGSIAVLISQIRIAKLPDKAKIVLNIDSPGGVLGSAMDFIDFIKEHDYNVTCIVDKHAMSAAFIILESDACTTRVVHANSILMIHGGAFVLAADQQFNELELETMLAHLRVMNQLIAYTISSRMKMTPQELLDRISHGKEWMIIGAEAIKFNLADQIIP
jgi:ATP-dependent protease ClpP protease subunit